MNKQTIVEVIDMLQIACEEKDWEMVLEVLNLLENPPSEFDELFNNNDNF